ncbi:MAG: TrkA C-terminal domain-containing protein, partial [Actinocatenispora sp.]
ERARPGEPALGGFRVAALALGESAPLAGYHVDQIAWPPGTRVMALRRDGRALHVDGRTELRRGDHLTVLVPAEHADALGDLEANRVLA